MRNIDPSLIVLLNEVRKTYESIPERFKNEDVSILTLVVEGLVNDVYAQHGYLYGTIRHSWLEPDPEKYDVIIDLCPKHIYPGPVIVKDVESDDGLAWYRYECDEIHEDLRPSKEVIERAKEIVAATEAARRFLSMP